MKRAIVLGATSGIGRELAKILTHQQYLVGITGRRTGLLETLKAEQPERYITHTFDLTETDTVAQHLEALTEELGGLDLLVINSGAGDTNDTLEFSVEQATIDINIAGFTCAADWAFNYFRRQGFGQLVGISSIAGIRGNYLAPAYNASKAYQINYLEGLRKKAFSLKIPVTVTDIRPGFVDTAMSKGDGKFWVASPQKAAVQIYRAIRERRAVCYVTRRWKWVALLVRLMPDAVYNRL